jgi:MtN3 and saliva related transmembrane protein
LVALTAGLSLWVFYGVLKGDWVLIGANTVAVALTAVVLGSKIRDRT